MSTNSTGMFAAFNAALDQVQKQKMEKMASDGFNTSMPADGSNNNTRDPKTGERYTEMSRDLKAAPFMEGNAETAPNASLTADFQESHGWNKGTRLYEADDKLRDYKWDKADPGTSMPAEAGSCCDKYASYTVHEHHRAIEKVGNFLMDCIESRQQVKQAAYAQQPAPTYEPESQYSDEFLQQIHNGRMYKLASIVNEAENDADLFINNATGVLTKLASGEEITDDLPIDSSEDSAAGEATDAAVADLLAQQGSAEEAIASLSPEEQEILASMSEDELIQLIQEIAEEDSGAVEAALADEGPAKEAAYYKYASDNESKKTQSESESNPPVNKGDAQALADAVGISEDDAQDIARAKDDELEGVIKLSSAVEAGLIDIDDVDEAVATEQIKEAAYYDFRDRMEKQAEAEASVDEALSELSPEELEALASMDEDELMELIKEIEGDEDEAEAEENEADGELLNSMAGEDEDEAINELSSAMTEEGVAPEDLAAMGKEGSVQRMSCYKLACAVKAYRDAGRYQYTEPKTQKRAQARALYRSALQTLSEYTN